MSTTSFTDTFDQADLDDKASLARTERNIRAIDNIDKYVPLPVAMPKASSIDGSLIGYDLGWAVGVPGEKKDHQGNLSRACLSIGFPDEQSALDFCYMLNFANQCRDPNRTSIEPPYSPEPYIKYEKLCDTSPESSVLSASS